MNKFLFFLIILSVFLIALPVLAQTVEIPNPLLVYYKLLLFLWA